SRWSSAQARAARLLVRQGQVSFNVPATSSNRSLSRRALRTRRISIGSGRNASSDASERALDHMILEFPRILLAHRPAARRLPRLVDRLPTTGDQIMPVE